MSLPRARQAPSETASESTSSTDHVLRRVRDAVGSHRYAHHVSTLGAATLADARSLPVTPSVGAALRRAGLAHGLVRGRTYGCSGVGMVSCAMTLLREASASGSWIAWCAAVSPNWRAAADIGWALDRVVRIECGHSSDGWIACLDSLAGEIDIVVIDLPAGVSLHEAQRTIDHAARRGGAVVALAASCATHTRLGIDIVFDVVRVRHATGHAYLAGQAMDIHLQGRRVPVAVDVVLDVPGARHV